MYPCWEWQSLHCSLRLCVPWGAPARGSPCALCHPHPAVPPRITLPPSLPGPVLLNAPVRLTCDATGTPSPTLMWLKDGNPVSTAGASGLQVSRLGSPRSPTWCLTGSLGAESGPGSSKVREKQEPPRMVPPREEAELPKGGAPRASRSSETTHAPNASSICNL